ncbi:MAG: hypothetical protein HPAVJP_1440 [Candidatus Hepatoplasma vulgare]|nr:MAG: hypothetical protein HPAVJP_1440 [Candidatus Hepatoplasma sp.]
MLTVKAYNQKSFDDFYKEILNIGKTRNIKTNIIFDEIFVDNIKITFFKNLTIFFAKDINKNIKEKLNILIDKKLYIGIDEVGVGENIGPYVVCAVKFKNFEEKKKVFEIGIKDSKKLDYKQIKKIAKEIKNHIIYKLIILKPEEFNKEWKEIKNVKQINALKQMELINEFYEINYQPVIDEFVNKEKFYNYFDNKTKINKNILFVQKAEDKYLEVACASIIAKDTYNNWLVDYLIKNDIPFKINKKIDSNGIYSMIKKNNLVVDKNKLFKEWAKNK